MQLDDVYDVRDAASTVALVVVVAARELDRELEVVVMEGSITLRSVFTGDSVDEMGEGGMWLMVGRLWAA